MELEIIKARYEHIFPVSSGMRAADIQEVLASGGHPVTSLTKGLDLSTKSWCALVGGEPCLLFGVAPISVISGVGSPWLLGTDRINEIPKQFLLKSRVMMDDMLRSFPRLVNAVDARNTLSIRWLKWLGFTIYPSLPLGINGELFHPFEKKLCVAQTSKVT